MSENQEQPEAQTPAGMTVNITEELDLPVVYANLCAIVATPEEVILTFAQREIGTPTEARAVVRVYLNPNHAQRVVDLLEKTLDRRNKQLDALLPQGVRDLIEGAKHDDSKSG